MNSVKSSANDEKNNQQFEVMNRLKEDLRSFIALSLKEDEATWEQWLSILKKDITLRCWEKKNCHKKDCPAYQNSCGRCWLIAGTLCGDKPIGKFAQKYKSCVACDIYQHEVLSDPIDELYEHLITLVYSLRNSKLELKTLALHDALTGLYNRNYLDVAVEREIKRIKRYGGAFTVIMIDIDNFKYINDTYGHVHGDSVLKEFAQILNKSIRGTDFLIRYGGDEFMIIKHEVSETGDNGIIHRIKNNFTKWNEEFGSENYTLSFSYGSAVFNTGKDFKSVIEEADAEMYRNKKNNSKR